MSFAASLCNVLFQSSTIFSPPSHFCPVVERTDMLLKEMKRYFRADLGRESTRQGGGALQPSTIIERFTMTTGLSQLQFNKAKPKSERKKEGERRRHWHLNLKQYSLPAFPDTMYSNKRIRMLKRQGKALRISNLQQSCSRSSLQTSVHLLLCFWEYMNQLLDVMEVITLPCW